MKTNSTKPNSRKAKAVADLPLKLPHAADLKGGKSSTPKLLQASASGVHIKRVT